MTNPILEMAMRRRADAGLRLEFVVPGRDDTFVCYAKDETQKQAWLASYSKRGWMLV